MHYCSFIPFMHTVEAGETLQSYSIDKNDLSFHFQLAAIALCHSTQYNVLANTFVFSITSTYYFSKTIWPFTVQQEILIMQGHNWNAELVEFPFSLHRNIFYQRLSVFSSTIYQS